VIAVVDYGVNNLRSVVRAFTAGGHPATLTSDPAEVRRAERVVIPGVGNFGQGSRNLVGTGLGDAVRDVARSGRPVLGICLGMQLLFAESEEAPGTRGLGLVEGRVIRFRTSLTIPHVGWAEVTLTPVGAGHPALGPLFGGRSQFFYHVHSYHPAHLTDGTGLATGDYGGQFPTIIGQGNVLGTQFHPEKSQQAGVALLARFAEWKP
jgi:imidazole glycerol-phosphate synthase subunit HisH